MVKKTLPIVIIILALAAILVRASAFTVMEYEQALVTEFGKPVGEPIREAGLYWRTPFIQKIHRFSKKILEQDGGAEEFLTGDKKLIYLDTFSRWRIQDPLRFKETVGEERTAANRLENIIESETRDIISNHPLIEAVRNSNRTLLQDAEIAEASRVLEAAGGEGGVEADEDGIAAIHLPQLGLDGQDKPTTIRFGREALTREIFENARSKISDSFGIELIDVQIKRVNYVERVQAKVFDRMISEREQIAERYRAQGERAFSEFQGTIKKEQNRILSEAYRTAETTKGEAEGEAARIYADAYGRDPEFYAFWRTLQIYRDTLGSNVSLVVGTDSDLFRYLKGAGN